MKFETLVLVLALMLGVADLFAETISQDREVTFQVSFPKPKIDISNNASQGGLANSEYAPTPPPQAYQSFVPRFDYENNWQSFNAEDLVSAWVKEVWSQDWRPREYVTERLEDLVLFRLSLGCSVLGPFISESVGDPYSKSWLNIPFSWGRVAWLSGMDSGFYFGGGFQRRGFGGGSRGGHRPPPVGPIVRPPVIPPGYRGRGF